MVEVKLVDSGSGDVVVGSGVVAVEFVDVGGSDGVVVEFVDVGLGAVAVELVDPCSGAVAVELVDVGSTGFISGVTSFCSSSGLGSS